MKTQFALPVAGILCLASASAFAASPKWDLVEVEYKRQTVEATGDFEPSGFAIFGSKLLTDNIFVSANYSDTDDDQLGRDLEISQATFSIGYRYGFNESTDVYATINHERYDVDGIGAGFRLTEDDDGFGATVGIRSMVTDVIELGAFVTHIDIEQDNDTHFGFNAFYYITDQIAVSAEISQAEDLDSYSIGVRYAF